MEGEGRGCLPAPGTPLPVPGSLLRAPCSLLSTPRSPHRLKPELQRSYFL